MLKDRRTLQRKTTSPASAPNGGAKNVARNPACIALPIFLSSLYFRFVNTLRRSSHIKTDSTSSSHFLSLSSPESDGAQPETASNSSLQPLFSSIFNYLLLDLFLVFPSFVVVCFLSSGEHFLLFSCDEINEIAARSTGKGMGGFCLFFFLRLCFGWHDEG